MKPFESYPNRNVSLGELQVARALPIRERRMIGPWCFLDHFGPVSFGETSPMDIAPHPHIGIQTVTWLIEGEVRHNDSRGNEAIVRPGGVNVMTAGHGIAHAERSPTPNSGRLNGIQLWVALSSAHREVAPAFESVAEVPVVEQPGGLIRVFSGSLENATSPVRHYSEILGADVLIYPKELTAFGLNPIYEHALMLLEGDVDFDGKALEMNKLNVLAPGRSSGALTSRGGGRVLLVGGPPFPEPVMMWWNFVARTRDEIAGAREDWEQHRRFGDVTAYPGPRLEAPDLARLAQPNPVS